MLAEVSGPDTVRLYNRLAPRYDGLHRRWLHYAGGEAQAALEAAVRAVMRPAMSLLDAGCGTGAFARALIDEGVPPGRMTLLDPSEAMLSRCSDLGVRRVVHRLERMPFAQASFDVVTCAWALETAERPAAALAELCRVVRPGGTLCLAFCADTPVRRPGAWLMRQAVRGRGAGVFLRRSFVEAAIRRDRDFEVRWLPCTGPAAALLARRREAAPAGS